MSCQKAATLLSVQVKKGKRVGWGEREMMWNQKMCLCMDKEKNEKPIEREQQGEKRWRGNERYFKSHKKHIRLNIDSKEC